MINKSIPISWLVKESRRLDCGPFVKGSLESRIKLENGNFSKEPLSTLTKNGIEGIYHVGQEKINWVNSEQFGYRFLRSSDILKINASTNSYISKAQVENNPKFMAEEGSTLITRSGTIGLMSYCRPELSNVAISQDVLKVTPDKDKILPGYLYAFLNSKFGIPLVVGGTFGSIIVHIEAENIADIPVPRLGMEKEKEIHKYVVEAASLREKASEKLNKVAKQFDSLLGDLDLERKGPHITAVSSKVIQKRFDAQYHDVTVKDIKEKISNLPHTSLKNWCSKIFLPGIFKRIHIDNLEYGSYYYTGASLFCLEPKPKGILSKKTSKYEEVYLEKGMILVQAFGQDGGLTGRSVWVGDHLDGQTTTHMLVRLQANSIEEDAYLFGFLQSEMAYKQIACLTYGGSIPHFDEKGISTVTMPIFDTETFNQIVEDVQWSVNARDRALTNEQLARKIIEETIEAAAPKH